MKPHRTWILVADAARARILESGGPGQALQEVKGGQFHGDHAPTHEIMSDRTGRSQRSTSPTRSAIEARSDPHRELKRQFAHSLADAMADALKQQSYDRLVIVAPPVTLGDLRAALSEQVLAKVVAEVAKDLTKTPDAQLAGHLKGVPGI
ncbi:MAG: host attachment protein [Hyphomicrobiaceae bacterium]|nr:MAG: host attachment protein [Hyphomicrobiaceae bacterium]